MKFESMGGVAEMKPPKKEKKDKEEKEETTTLKEELDKNVNEVAALAGEIKYITRERLSEMSDEELVKLNKKLDELLQQQRQILGMPKSRSLPKNSDEIDTKKAA